MFGFAIRELVMQVLMPEAGQNSMVTSTATTISLASVRCYTLWLVMRVAT